MNLLVNHGVHVEFLQRSCIGLKLLMRSLYMCSNLFYHIRINLFQFFLFLSARFVPLNLKLYSSAELDEDGLY